VVVRPAIGATHPSFRSTSSGSLAQPMRLRAATSRPIFAGVALLIAGFTSMSPASVGAATLPEHTPFRLLVVADEVNPWELSDEALTQPIDVEVALSDSASGLLVETIVSVDSQCVDEAFGVIDGGVDVIVYFAHLPAIACDGTVVQDQLTEQFAAHLERGGGIVVFHHGIYVARGKASVLQLLGGNAGGVEFGEDGQDVINVAPGHFVTTNGLTYAMEREFESSSLGIPLGMYGVFANSPDERYSQYELTTVEGERREILFVNARGQPIAYDLTRPGWRGRVITYQPGEYQPNAIDDRDGSNFQVLANAIYYAATEAEDLPPPSSDDGSTDTGDDDDGTPGTETLDPEDDGGGDEDPTSSATSPDPDPEVPMETGDAPPPMATSTQSSGSCSVHPVGPKFGASWILAAWGLAGVLRRRRRPRSASPGQ